LTFLTDRGRDEDGNAFTEPRRTMPDNKTSPDCFECKHRGDVSGGRLVSCNHPAVESSEGNDPVSEATAFLASVGRLPPVPDEPRDELNIRGDLRGVRDGSFRWPYSYDPVWLENCDGFEPKGEMRMSELENRLEKTRRWYRDAIGNVEGYRSELGRNAARTNAVDLKNEIEYLEMLISDADRLARGEEISLVVKGTFETWVENAEELWDLVFDHALQVKDEIKEAELDELLSTTV
jgi:hypothetical protein